MAKKDKKKNDENEKAQVIIGAKLRDGHCDYKVEVKKGIGVGDKITVTGDGIAKQDLIDSMKVFNKHLACLDDIFKHNKVDIDNIDNFENHKLTGLYDVTGFKMGGNDESETIILIGSKALSVGGRSDFSTPKISLDELSPYKWYNELQTAADNMRKEVELYREGKVELSEEEQKPDPKQTKMFGKDKKVIDLNSAKVD